MIRPLRRTYVVVVRWTDEMLCGVYKRASRFEPPCICTRWTGERWVEQVSRLHGTTRWRQCGSIAMKLSRLDVCEGWKVVRWCRTQTSSHNSQGVVDGGVDEAGMSTAAPDRSTLQLNVTGLVWLFAGLLLQHPSLAPTGASKPPQECDAWCQLLVKWLKVSAVRERPFQRYSEVFGLRTEGQGFVVVNDLSSRLASLLLRWKAADIVFVVLSFSFQVWRYSPTAAISLVSTPSTACQSPSACMIARSSAYFLETVIGRSEM